MRLHKNNFLGTVKSKWLHFSRKNDYLIKRGTMKVFCNVSWMDWMMNSLF